MNINYKLENIVVKVKSLVNLKIVEKFKPI